MSDGGYIEGNSVPGWPKLRDEYIISMKEAHEASKRALEVLRRAAAGAKAENEHLARVAELLGTATATATPGTASASVSDAPAA